MYDAIIVGARCAGASTAMLLPRKGHKVLLVDRSPCSSDIPHGHLIHRHGPRRLKDWGLLDRDVASGSPPITEFSTFMKVVDAFPSLSARVRAGYREERLRGVIDLPNFLRTPFGDGRALVGDASCHKDSYLARGMCDALRDAELLANAIDLGAGNGGCAGGL